MIIQKRRQPLHHQTAVLRRRTGFVPVFWEWSAQETGTWAQVAKAAVVSCSSQTCSLIPSCWVSNVSMRRFKTTACRFHDDHLFVNRGWDLSQFIYRSIDGSKDRRLDGSMDTSIHPFIKSSIDRSFDPSIHTSVRKSIHPSIYPSTFKGLMSRVHIYSYPCVCLRV